MKKLIALVMTLVLAVSMAAMASAANAQDTHGDNCPDCAAVSVQPRSPLRCINSSCGGQPLVSYSYLPAKVCGFMGCQYIAYGYECPNCHWHYYYCGASHIIRV